MEKIVIKNKVKEIAEKRSLDRNQFIGLCLSSRKRIDGKGLTADTAGRVYDGETGLSLRTAALIAAALGLSIEDVFDLSEK